MPAKRPSKKRPSSRKKTTRSHLNHSSAPANRRPAYRQPQGLSMVKGGFVLHANGYGFVRPDVAGMPDIFIPPHATAGALTLDYVEVSIQGGKGNRISGKILRVLNPCSQTLVGTVFKKNGHFYFAEKRSSRSFPLHVPPKVQLEPDTVIVAARGYKKNSDMVRYDRTIDPTRFDDCRGALLAEFGLQTEFPPEVLQEMTTLTGKGRDVLGLPESKRADLRSKAIVTIDGEDAKDFDDAVYAEKTKTGEYHLWVSIADVSAFVEEAMACDREAYHRGTSTYFPGFALPMLPERLSSDLCSLVPKQDRWTLTAELKLASDGTPISKTIYPSIIHSHARLTYTEVQQFLDHKEVPHPKITTSIAHSLGILEELAQKLMKRRRGRGSLDFDLPEAVFILNSDRELIDIREAKRLFSHRLIEELMILANEAVAEFMEEHELAGLWRIHESPDPVSLEHFLMSLKTYSHVEISSKNRGRTKEPEDAPAAPLTGKTVQSWIESFKGRPHEPFMMKLLLRSLKQAHYREENVGHFGLASTSYAHFTSPIRRYPDLYIHRLLRRFLMQSETLSRGSPRRQKQKKQAQDQANAATVASFTSHRERISMEAEREMNKLYSVFFMKDKLGAEFEGVISHTTPQGFYVLLKDYFVEGFVSKDDLDPLAVYDVRTLTWTVDRTATRYELSKSVRVQLVSANLYDRAIRFTLTTS